MRSENQQTTADLLRQAQGWLSTSSAAADLAQDDNCFFLVDFMGDSTERKGRR